MKNSASRVGGAERPGGVPCTLAFASHPPKCDPRGQWAKMVEKQGVTQGFVVHVWGMEKQSDEGGLKIREQ